MEKVIYKMLDFENFAKDRYLIGSDGTIINAKTGRKHRPKMTKGGYLHITLLREDKKPRTIGVQRLVAAMHCPGRTKEKWHVDHVNYDKLNNHASNLEWVTPEENNRRALVNGLLSRPGELNPAAVHSDESVRLIADMLKENLTYEDILKNLNWEDIEVNRHFVRDIKRKSKFLHILKDYDFSDYITIKGNNRNIQYLNDVKNLILDGYTDDEIFHKMGWHMIKDSYKDEKYIKKKFIKKIRKKIIKNGKGSTTIENPRKLIIRINLPE